MAKITDPTSLSFSVNGTPGTTQEVYIDTGLKTIQLRSAGNLDDTSPGKTSGVTAKALYSALKEEWLDGTFDGGATDFSATLRRFKFPLKMIFEGSFIWVNGWAPADVQTRDLFRDAGFQEGVSGDIYSCLISLGAMDDAALDQAYYTQAAGVAAPTVLIYDKTGELNENVDITGNTTYLKSFLREEGKLFSEYNLLLEQGLSAISFQAYSFPLSNGEDLKRTLLGLTDAFIQGANAPYNGMAIDYLEGTGFTTLADVLYPADAVVQDSTGRWFHTVLGGTSNGGGTVVGDTGVTDWVSYFGEEQIGADWYAFNRIVNANGGTDLQTYGFMQSSLKLATTINDLGASFSITADQGITTDVIGQVAPLLGFYVGDTLKPAGGVLLRGFDTNSTNSIVHSPIDVDSPLGLDSEGVPTATTEVPFPFVAAGNFNFSANLDAATNAETFYTVYFSYITRTTTVGGLAITGASGTTAVIDVSGETGILDHLASGDYIYLTGFSTNSTNDGLYITNEATGDTTADEVSVTKQDGVTIIDDAVGDTIQVDQNPFESPGAVIVKDNAGPTDMSSTITAATIGWDFDYTNNVQGGRTPDTDAPIRVVAQALDGAEWIDATHTITKATGQNIAINANDERNYSNPV